jgi:hypothetical protein
LEPNALSVENWNVQPGAGGRRNNHEPRTLKIKRQGAGEAGFLDCEPVSTFSTRALRFGGVRSNAAMRGSARIWTS